MNKLLELLDYLIKVDRGLTNYDTDILHRMLEEVREELGYAKQ